MSSRLVPKSVSLDDLERRNGPYFAFFTELGSFRSPSFSSADESLLWKYVVGYKPGKCCWPEICSAVAHFAIFMFSV